jgi:NADPH-dependent curcumin reductase CurA
MENRRIILNARPVGVPGAEFFRIDTAPVDDLSAGQFLIKNMYLSVDPAMRGWANDAPNYSPPVPVGDVMRAFAVGEIIASENPDYAVGELVAGVFGWQRFAISDGSNIMRRVARDDLSPTLALGVLGLNGITAYFGLLDVCNPQSGETVIVSTSAGAVGSCVGQIAKIQGCKAVGITGGPEKVALCLSKFGYDEAIDYKNASDINAEISAACPDGVNCYFDNTCGPISDAVFEHLVLGARITVCGTASLQEWEPIPQGPRIHRQLMINRARMTGFLVLDYNARYMEAVDQLAIWVRSGQISIREHILDGMDHAPGALEMLYRGENTGKLLIKVD